MRNKSILSASERIRELEALAAEIRKYGEARQEGVPSADGKPLYKPVHLAWADRLERLADNLDLQVDAAANADSKKKSRKYLEDAQMWQLLHTPAARKFVRFFINPKKLRLAQQALAASLEQRSSPDRRKKN